MAFLSAVGERAARSAVLDFCQFRPSRFIFLLRPSLSFFVCFFLFIIIFEITFAVTTPLGRATRGFDMRADSLR